VGHEHGYGSAGETMEFDLTDDGQVRSIGGSGGTSWPFDVFSTAVAARDRVEVGASIRPVTG